ncbi:tRNA (guanosine(37)-N1)-methyltransferase TrmD [Candidatus Soleaferrea massiliensis]|uniref:tRNA (guanosine(37)-N1)-methyltransferase TrmD n=1 Tax=Candidatus Soleaferrea massiliensis TaxID=1470354 RepID=UPI00058F6F96|nr:tRNA (guanosine(37)-N1)-methyltransferase TrmD [Candidatus Soleaferrea massiliensis]
MRIDLATLFPEMCEAYLGESIIGRARTAGFLDIHSHNIRDYTLDKQKRVDDYPYGGGKGVVMQADPIYRCWQAICEMSRSRPYVVYMSPQGKVLTQQRAVELSKKKHIMMLCGHYEGVDERIIEEIVDEELSIGDYVLTGGELPALVTIDTIARLCEGVLSDEECFTSDSHYNGLLEFPQYTRPAEWNGKKAPEVLLSGHHANIEAWRHEQALKRTFYKRRDLLEQLLLTDEESCFLEHLRQKEMERAESIREEEGEPG